MKSSPTPWKLGTAAATALACVLAVVITLSLILSHDDDSSNTGAYIQIGSVVYRGFHDTGRGLNTWHRIPFAEPPTGSLRWQAPVPISQQSDNTSSKSLQDASSLPPRCPQAPSSAGPSVHNVFHKAFEGSEDCLYLSVFAPIEAENLPVFVWIHGGGYGQGDATQDLSGLISASNNSFIAVGIQYRLGAFGFLASQDVRDNGVLNAGLLDQHFALEWVQQHIGLFGGDGSRVTIAGQSAGAGAVMLLAMGNGGTEGVSLFQNAIAASPYLPLQHNYSDVTPTKAYNDFALLAGCTTSNTFACLVAADSWKLQNASYAVSVAGIYGSWQFVPVTDGTFVQDTPNKQLAERRVNGLRVLTGNNADEGPVFVDQNITTQALFVEFLQDLLPSLTDKQYSQVEEQYPILGRLNDSDSSAVRFATWGDSGLTALNESAFAIGMQQRANNLYAELTFACPSYWLADAFSGTSPQGNLTGYKYQYSIIPALHGNDATAYFGPPSESQSAALVADVMSLWYEFITTGGPTSATTPTWPAFITSANDSTPTMLNLNQTGGTPTNFTRLDDLSVVEYVGDGLSPDFRLVDAWAWEGGRGQRCQFWRDLGV